MIRATLLFAACLLAPPKTNDCERDVAFALTELEKKCGHFFETKDIDWKSVSKEMLAAAKVAKDESAHFGVLRRLVSRLKDGHAYVAPTDEKNAPKLPAELVPEGVAPGIHLCQDTKTKKVYVKASWGAARRAGLTPGLEIISVDGKPAEAWVKERVAYWREIRSFGTDAHVRGFALSRGMAMPRGTKLKLTVKGQKGGTKSLTLAFQENEDRRPFPPVEQKGARDVAGLTVATTPAGFGYVHVPKIEDDLPTRMDQALAAIGDAKGLVLDFRGNTGGGCDHDALLGLFVPKGESMKRESAGPISSFGESPYGGNLVVIVDGMVVSSGETASGMFKEDGRGYMIGDDHTAGMSGSKEDIALPSGKFLLHVVVRSNKGRFNDGRGIEGVGVIPNEIVAYSPEDLSAGVDTLIARADALLSKFPQNEVPYRAN